MSSAPALRDGIGFRWNAWFKLVRPASGLPRARSSDLPGCIHETMCRHVTALSAPRRVAEERAIVPDSRAFVRLGCGLGSSASSQSHDPGIARLGKSQGERAPVSALTRRTRFARISRDCEVYPRLVGRACVCFSRIRRLPESQGLPGQGTAACGWHGNPAVQGHPAHLTAACTTCAALNPGHAGGPGCPGASP